jgi:hypothetical protein
MHVRRNCTGLRLPDNQVEMIRHEREAVDVHWEVFSGFGQPVQKGPVVRPFKEERSLLVPPIDDVDGGTKR